MKNRTPDGLTSGQWTAVIEGLEHRPSTVNDYRKVLNLLHSYKDGEYRIDTMTKEQAEEYFAYLDQRQAEGTLSENTVHRYKATLRSIGTRIESHPDLWPGYHNPFSGLVTNENRKRTEYRTDMFANAEDIHRIHDTFDQLSKEERLILSFMMYLGLTPAQIQNLKISDFFLLPGETRRLAVRIGCGTFLEPTTKPWKESSYYLNNYPVKFVRSSHNRSITWDYTGTFVFSDSFAEELRNYYEFIGTSTDSRAFFLTARHLEFNYRAMHHMILGVCAAANVDSSAITPNLISRYGLVHAYLIDRAQRNPEDEAARNTAEPLLAFGNIGQWEERFPVPMQERIDSIQNHLGNDFLKKVVGL